MRKHRKQTGFGLIELMIAVALGLLILVAISQLFIGSRLTYNTADALARVQENGRFALEILKPELRDLGGQGFCAGRLNLRNHLREDCAGDVQAIFDANNALMGWEYDNTGIGDEYDLPDSLNPEGEARGNWASRQSDGSQLDLPEALQDRVVPGSDIIIVRSMNRMNILVDGINSKAKGGVIDYDPDPDEIPENSILMVINCAEGGDLFQQGGGNANQLYRPKGSCDSPGPGNASQPSDPWAVRHEDSSSVFNVDVTAYYIGYNAERDEPGLYRLSLSRGLDDDDLQAEELVQGIENMQILYGFSRPAPQGDGQFVDFWLTADQITDWGLVVAARVSVLARSQEAADVQREQFTFDLSRTQVTHPEDRLLRQPFSTTLALRNRLIVQ